MFPKHAFCSALLAAIIAISSFSFISTSARTIAVDSPFRLPVGPGLNATVFQGNNSQYDHVGIQKYAFDFIVGQSNFVVTAAQSGKVIGTENTSSIRCKDATTLYVGDGQPGTPYPNCWAQANYVLIQNDGIYNGQETAALYLHLLPHSVRVQVGDLIKRGDPIGLADTTGWAEGPHLHFQVEQIPPESKLNNKPPGWWFTQSVPVAFSNPEVLRQQLSSDGVPKVDQTFLLQGIPISSIQSGGIWNIPPSPQDGAAVNDKFQLSARGYPARAGDPAIDHVNFTIGSQGSWKTVCTVPAPKTGDEFDCNVNLKALGIPYGQIQVSFDVYDVENNFHLAPNGVHTLTYGPAPVPAPTPNFTQFVGAWYAHAQQLVINADGKATYTGRVFVWCVDDQGNTLNQPPCDGGGNQGINPNQNALITFNSVIGNTASGTIMPGGTGMRSLDSSLIPIGSTVTITLNPSNDTLNVSNGILLCGSQAIQNQVDIGCTSGA